MLLAVAGACATSLFNLTLQMGIELTYPASILMTGGLLGFAQQTMAQAFKSLNKQPLNIYYIYIYIVLFLTYDLKNRYVSRLFLTHPQGSSAMQFSPKSI